MNPILMAPEFLRELGISRPTFDRYRREGRLPPPPTAGKHAVYTREYLVACRKILAAQGLPHALYRDSGKRGGKIGGRPKRAAATA